MTQARPAEDLLYDLAIVGGGIVGAAVARDAALRGLSVVLFEKSDFGAGASCYSSKLAHGGLRYLEYGELGLVRESLRERNLLLKLCPEWVRPLQFMLPVYTSNSRPLWQIKLGIGVYQWLAHEHAKTDTPHLHSNTEILEYLPGLETTGLRGAGTYLDAQMHDARLVIENILSAERHGAYAYNYTEVMGLKSLRPDRHRIRVQADTWVGHIEARCVVNATGAWSNIALERLGVSSRFVAPSKGVHIVLPKMGLKAATLLQNPVDQRHFFVIPWEERTLIGTTDTFFHGDPDDIEATAEDSEYLLHAFKLCFPDSPFTTNDILASFVGLRPLLAASAKRSASRVSRRHKVTMHAPGILSVAGGKFTTYRAIAEEVVDKAVLALEARDRVAPCITHRLPLIEQEGGSGAPHSGAALKALEAPALSQGCHARLVREYGPHIATLSRLMHEFPELQQRICTRAPYLKAEIQYAVQFEKVIKIEDWLERRTHIGLTQKLSKEFIRAGKSALAQSLKTKRAD